MQRSVKRCRSRWLFLTRRCSLGCQVLSAGSGTRSGFLRRRAARWTSAFPVPPKTKFRKERENFLSVPSRKAVLGTWKPDPLAQLRSGCPESSGDHLRSDTMQMNRIDQLSVPTNTVLHGDCISIMRGLPTRSIDFILTDPPYLVRYQDREGRSIRNDSNSDWLMPAFTEAYRVLKQDRLMIAFYGWTQVDKFLTVWRSAGFRVVGHLVFRKQYSSRARFLNYH